MKKRSKLFLALFNGALLGLLTWVVLRLAYAPAGISLALTSNMEGVGVDQMAELRFEILDENGQVITNFERVHEKLMHLIFVRKDLSQFQHLHPEIDKATGEFSVDIRFAQPGDYELFADFTPEHSTQMVLPFELTVGGDYEPVTLSVSGPDSFDFEGFTVTPHFPETIETGMPVDYSFDVKQDDKAVTLEDYLGAKGHSVVLSEEELSYLHTHPIDDSLSFQTVFNEEGVYKTFTQFQVEGRVYTIEYVFEVKEVEDTEERGDSMEEMDSHSH